MASLSLVTEVSCSIGSLITIIVFGLTLLIAPLFTETASTVALPSLSRILVLIVKNRIPSFVSKKEPIFNSKNGVPVICRNTVLSISGLRGIFRLLPCRSN